MREEAMAKREMPKYKCHKEVWALQIGKMEVKVPTIAELEAILEEHPHAQVPMATITPADEGYGAFPIYQEFWGKHLMRLKPEEVVGGYYVVYEDGYASFSPRKAFEDGYTRI